MIKFKEDWKKYPNAIVHTKTNNKSFLAMSIKYKLNGVENHTFMLQLHNPLLEEVDPHDEDNLTREQKDMIIAECMINPWYYLREVVRLPMSGGKTTRLKANRGNIPLFWFFFCHIFIILIQIRQTGKSANTDVLKSYGLFYGTLDSVITFLTNSNKNRTESVDRIRTIEELLPKYLRILSGGDINNQYMIGLSTSNKNKYSTAVAQSSIEKAKMIHRGATTPIRHIDEFAYITNLKESLAAMLAAGNSADDQAKESGSLYGTILSTTAGYKDTKHGKYAYKLYTSAAVFVDKLFDSKNQKELEHRLKKMSKDGEPRVLIEMNHRQLGKTDEWLKSKISSTAAEGNQVLTDFLNIWVSEKGKELLTPDDLKKITDSRVLDTNLEISDIEGYTLRWFISDDEIENIKNNNIPIIAGLDSSDAIGSDDISIVIRKVTTGEVLAAGDFNETNLTIFGEYVASLLIKYPSMTLVIERRSSGTGLIDTIIPILIANDINPLSRVFNWIVNDIDTRSREYKLLSTAFKAGNRREFDKHKKAFGFATSGSGRTSRYKLYGEIFKAAVKYTGSTVRDNKLINQLNGLVEINGRIDHEEGGNDDLIIAWLLSLWILKSGKNLKYYNIDKNKVLINIKETIYKDGKKDIDKMHKMKKHNMAMEAITKISNKIKESNNALIEREGRMAIKKLSAFIDKSLAPSFNVDIYLSKLDEEKRMLRKIKNVA